MTKIQPKSASTNPPPPTVSKELIGWLERTYPDRAQDINTPQREADARFGEIRIVRSLRAIHDRQMKS